MIILTVIIDTVGVPYNSLTTNQMQSLVHRVRHKEFQNWESLISSAPLVFCADNDRRMFLQFNVNINIKEKMEKIIGWAHPDLKWIARSSGLNLFVDCTFKVAPAGFSQLMIVMALEPATECYVPLYYVLLQSKHEETYQAALNLIIMSSDFKLNAVSISCDFECALMNAVITQFPEVEKTNGMIMCLFHWKQCLRRKPIGGKNI